MIIINYYLKIILECVVAGKVKKYKIFLVYIIVYLEDMSSKTKASTKKKTNISI